jgi:hypothetical protein
VDRIVALNPKIDVIYFNDKDCTDFLAKSNPSLGKLFSEVTHGPFKSDLCRTGWLFAHGGWYMDMDVDMRLSFPSIVKPGTTFFAAWGTQADGRDILNALMGVAKGSPILHHAIEWMLSPDGQKGCLAKDGLDCGTKATRKGMNIVAQRCGVQPPSRFLSHDFEACGQKVQLAKEIDLADAMQRQEADEYDPKTAELAIEGRNISNFRGKDNAKKHFEGLNYALIYPGPPSIIVGYSRFDACTHFGCEGGEENLALEPEAAPAPHPPTPVQNLGATHWYNQIIQSFSFGGSTGAGHAQSQASPWYARLFPSPKIEEKFAWLSTHAQWY